MYRPFVGCCCCTATSQTPASRTPASRTPASRTPSIVAIPWAWDLGTLGPWKLASNSNKPAPPHDLLPPATAVARRASFTLARVAPPRATQRCNTSMPLLCSSLARASESPAFRSSNHGCQVSGFRTPGERGWPTFLLAFPLSSSPGLSGPQSLQPPLPYPMHTGNPNPAWYIHTHAPIPHRLRLAAHPNFFLDASTHSHPHVMLQPAMLAVTTPVTCSLVPSREPLSQSFPSIAAFANRLLHPVMRT